MTDAIRIEHLTALHGKTIACREISFIVPSGAVYVLLGREGAGKTTLLDCLRGRQKPDAGRALIFGEDSRKYRRRLSKRIATAPGELENARDLGIFDEPKEVSSLAPDCSRTVLIATRSPALVERIATRFGILKKGRLVLDAPITALEIGIRRLRYQNRMTETRTSFGTELDEFHALRVQVRGWGIDAIVSDFADAAFDRFRAIDGVEDATAEVLTLDEVFQALA